MYKLSQSQSLHSPWPAVGKLNNSGRIQNRNQDIRFPDFKEERKKTPMLLLFHVAWKSFF